MYIDGLRQAASRGHPAGGSHAAFGPRNISAFKGSNHSPHTMGPLVFTSVKHGAAKLAAAHLEHRNDYQQGKDNR